MWFASCAARACRRSFLFNVKTTVRGYHIYGVVGGVQEGFFVLHKKENRHKKHAMVVFWDEELLVIVGHMPQEIAEMCYFFTKHDGQIIGEVTGH